MRTSNIMTAIIQKSSFLYLSRLRSSQTYEYAVVIEWNNRHIQIYLFYLCRRWQFFSPGIGTDNIYGVIPGWKSSDVANMIRRGPLDEKLLWPNTCMYWFYIPGWCQSTSCILLSMLFHFCLYMKRPVHLHTFSFTHVHNVMPDILSLLIVQKASSWICSFTRLTRS